GNYSEVGSVRVFSGIDGHVLRTYLGSQPVDRLGSSLAGGFDVNGDGVPDLIAGAIQQDHGAGYALVWSGSDGTLQYVLPGAANGDFFGCSVALCGDLDGDGKSEFAVGAYAHAGPSSGAGEVRVYAACTPPHGYCT